MEDSKFQFKGFAIKKAFFERKDGEPSTKFDLNFSPKGFVNKKESRFQLHLGVNITDEKDVFSIEIQAVADFIFSSGIESKQLNSFFYVNAPAILFPYIRAYISTLTTLSGLKPLTLPTLNLTNLGKELENNTVNIDDTKE
jgi:preprotein translocase subunit SecB